MFIFPLFPDFQVGIGNVRFLILEVSPKDLRPLFFELANSIAMRLPTPNHIKTCVDPPVC